MLAIGIDPGLDGYVAMVDGKNVLFTAQTPTIMVGKGNKRAYDVTGMRNLLVRLKGELTHPVIVLEKQQAMPKSVQGRTQGVASTFNTGYGYGLWHGLIVGLGFRFAIVHPRTWQSKMHRDIPGDDTKGRSIIACHRLYPCHSLLRTERCKKPDHNMAEAILLAHYGIGQEGGPK